MWSTPQSTVHSPHTIIIFLILALPDRLRLTRRRQWKGELDNWRSKLQQLRTNEIYLIVAWNFTINGFKFFLSNLIALHCLLEDLFLLKRFSHFRILENKLRIQATSTEENTVCLYFLIIGSTAWTNNISFLLNYCYNFRVKRHKKSVHGTYFPGPILWLTDRQIWDLMMVMSDI